MLIRCVLKSFSRKNDMLVFFSLGNSARITYRARRSVTSHGSTNSGLRLQAQVVAEQSKVAGQLLVL